MWIKLLPLLKKLLAYLLPFLEKKVDEAISQPIAVVQLAPEQPKAPVQPVEIDWKDPKSKINKRFTVKEATYLPSWEVYHIPSEDQKKQIVDIATRVDRLLDKLEEELGKKLKMDVHVWMRPGVTNVPGTKWDGMDYNHWLYMNVVWKNLTAEEKAKKKVPNSPHKSGNAIDGHIEGFEGKPGCAKMRDLAEPHLAEFGLREEDLEGTWVHWDSNAPGKNPDGTERRRFKP